MNICILSVDNINSASEISKYEPFVNPMQWLLQHHTEHYFLTNSNYKIILNDLLIKNFDVFFNLCDGAKGENRPGIEVVKFLEKNKISFTGANSKFYEPSRIKMKKISKIADIPYPKGVIIKSVSDIIKISKKLNFPLIVKHYNSYNSVGLTKNSVVYNLKDLKIQAEKIISKYSAALIEEYIEGKEFTVLVAENYKNKNKPYVFEPMQIVFPKGETFKNFDLKWKKHSVMKYKNVSDKLICNKLKNYSSKMFIKMNGSGYARCDLRMNKNSEIFMLEINPNCSIYFPKNDPSSADEILYNQKNGHKIFTDLILKSALNKKYEPDSYQDFCITKH